MPDPLNILSFIHPVRTFTPCSGVGRHINGVLGSLSQEPDVNLKLWCSRQWVNPHGKLPENCPLRDLETLNFPFPENPLERTWKLLGLPKMDHFVPKDTDWIYAPVETRIPVRQCPVAITLHDIQAFEPNLPWSDTPGHQRFRKRWELWVRKAIRESRLVFTVSEFSRRRIIELLDAPEDKVVVSGNGVDPIYFESEFPEPPGLESLNQRPYVCMIGGLRHKKGGRHYLNLAKVLREQNSEIQIVMIGQHDEDLQKEAESHLNLQIFGKISDTDWGSWLAHSLAMVFLSEYEGFGIPPLEAMAVGTPVIVSNRASLPEIVGDAGKVVEPDHTEEIVKWLEHLLTDPSARQDWIEKGRRHVEAFTWERCAQKVHHAFKENN